MNGNGERRRGSELEGWEDEHADVAPRPAPGKVTLTSRLPRVRPAPAPARAARPASAPIQRMPLRDESDFLAAALRGEPGAVAAPVQLSARAIPEAGPDETRAIAERGTRAGGGALPYLSDIQRSFGRHDVTGVSAHTGADAERATRMLGARAYATGDSVVLGPASDKHTVAHEAAHVIQQRAGVHLSGGVGAAGDRHEQHADRVADRVIRGESAEALLDEYTAGSAGGGVQLLRAYTGESALRKIDSAIARGDRAFVSALHQQLAGMQNPGYAQDATVTFQSGGVDWSFTVPGGPRWDTLVHNVEVAQRELERAREEDDDAPDQNAAALVESTTRRSRTDRERGAQRQDTEFRIARRIDFPPIQLVSVNNPSPYIDSVQIQITSNLEIGQTYAPSAPAGDTAEERAADRASQDDRHMGNGPLAVGGGGPNGNRVSASSDGALLAAAQRRWRSLEGFPISDQLSSNSDGEGSIGVQIDLSEYLFPGLAFQFVLADLSRDDGLRMGMLQVSQGLRTPVFADEVNGQRTPMRLSGTLEATLDPNWAAIARHFSGEAAAATAAGGATVAETEAAIAAGGAGTAAGVATAAVLVGVLWIGGTMWAMQRATEQGRRRGLQSWYGRAYADRFAARVFGASPSYSPDSMSDAQREYFVNGRNDAHVAINRMSAAQQAQLRAHYRTRRALEQAIRAELARQFDGRS